MTYLVWRLITPRITANLHKCYVASSYSYICGEGEVKCDLLHRRKIASLCMFYKIFNNACHPVRLHYPDLLVPTRVTRRTAVMHEIMFWWLLVVELSSIWGLLSQLVLLFGITLMALFLMVWIWVATSLRLIVLFLVDLLRFFSLSISSFSSSSGWQRGGFI